MAESILSDEMLSDLIAAGQVDVLVGIPTFNNAATVEATVRAVHVGFAKYFSRERTLLINSDGGSEDGTREIVRNASLGESETFIATHVLRTIHRISAPYHGLPGKRSAVRAIFAAADLLQAKAVAVLDPDVVSITPDWLAALLKPVLRDQFEFVAPIYPRQRFDGPLITQLIRPLVRATYGFRLQEPLAGEFGCSRRFVAHCLAEEVWDSDFARFGIDPWLSGTAMAGGFRLCQTHLGTQRIVSSQQRPPLPQTLQQTVGALFQCLELHQGYWQGRQGSEPVPTIGNETEPPGEDSAIDAAAMVESFRSGVRDLAPILKQILRPDIHEQVLQLAEPPDGPIHYPDALWVATVYEFAASYHRAVMHRDHLLLALVPLYLGQIASFVVEHGAREAPDVEQHLEALGLEYERSKPHLIECWNA